MFTRGYLDVLGGDYVNVSLATPRRRRPRRAVRRQVQFCDGRNNAWHLSPEHTKHL